MSDKKLILGSGSPRRKELLQNLGFEFTTLRLEMDEAFPSTLDAQNVAEYLAKKKNEYYRRNISEKNQVLLTSDTTVIINNTLLEKPQNEEVAKEMLQTLSGSMHQVVTGVCISNDSQKTSFSRCTNVHFKILTEKEIEFYINAYRPFDKAGGYGIQEWIGMIGIDRIEGSYFNVMGLPTKEVYETLLAYEISPSRR